MDNFPPYIGNERVLQCLHTVCKLGISLSLIKNWAKYFWSRKYHHFLKPVTISQVIISILKRTKNIKQLKLTIKTGSILKLFSSSLFRDFGKKLARFHIFLCLIMQSKILFFFSGESLVNLFPWLIAAFVFLSPKTPTLAKYLSICKLSSIKSEKNHGHLGYILISGLEKIFLKQDIIHKFLPSTNQINCWLFDLYPLEDRKRIIL